MDFGLTQVWADWLHGLMAELIIPGFTSRDVEAQSPFQYADILWSQMVYQEFWTSYKKSKASGFWDPLTHEAEGPTLKGVCDL